MNRNCKNCGKESKILDTKIIFFPGGYRFTIELEHIFCHDCISMLLGLFEKTHFVFPDSFRGLKKEPHRPPITILDDFEEE